MVEGKSVWGGGEGEKDGRRVVDLTLYIHSFAIEVFVDVREEILLAGIVLSDHRRVMLKDYIEIGNTKLRTSVANSLGRFFPLPKFLFQLLIITYQTKNCKYTTWRCGN